MTELRGCRRFPAYDHHAPAVAPRIRDYSPWGCIDDVNDVGEGMVSVSTSSHGGLWVSPEANKLIPAKFRRVDRWYEEDCEIVIPLSFCRALLYDPPEDYLERTAQALRSMFPYMAEWIDAHGYPAAH